MGLVANMFKVLIQEPNNGKTIASSTLTDASIEVAMTTNDIIAGNNELIAILHSGRDINIPMTDVEWKYDYLAMQLGQDIKTAAGIAYSMPKFYTAIDETGVISITLDEIPSDANSIKIYKLDETEITGFTSVGEKVTFSTGIEAGDTVEVRTYKYTTAATTQTIEIDNDIFPADYIVVLETIEIDHDEQPTHKLQYQFDRVKPTGNITLNTTSDKNATSQQINFRVLKPKTSTVVGRALRIPVEAV